jgi:hypothetical protein
MARVQLSNRGSDSSPETCHSWARRGKNSECAVKDGLWPAAGGHERLPRRCETRKAEAERRAASEKPDGQVWVDSCGPRQAKADAGGRVAEARGSRPPNYR